MRGGLCISPDWPGWGLLLMAGDALSAGLQAGALGPGLNGSPAREKEGWLASQTHGQTPKEGGGGGLTQAGHLPASDMCGGV